MQHANVTSSRYLGITQEIEWYDSQSKLELYHATQLFRCPPPVLFVVIIKNNQKRKKRNNNTLVLPTCPVPRQHGPAVGSFSFI